MYTEAGDDTTGVRADSTWEGEPCINDTSLAATASVCRDLTMAPAGEPFTISAVGVDYTGNYVPARLPSNGGGGGGNLTVLLPGLGPYDGCQFDGAQQLRSCAAVDYGNVTVFGVNTEVRMAVSVLSSPKVSSVAEFLCANEYSDITDLPKYRWAAHMPCPERMQ